MAQKQVTIIYNPMSGRRGRRAELAAEMVKHLEAHGLRAEALATAGPGDATRLTAAAIAGGANLIISYGGDGTLNEVIQAVVGTEASVAVWAGGTANVVARDLRLPRHPKPLAEVIATGKTRRIALGCATRFQEPGVGAHGRAPVQESEAQARRYFFMFAGIGLDASIARGVNRKLKRQTGEFAFWVSGIKHLLMWKRDRFTVEIDGKIYESAFTLVGNGKGYGGRLEMAKNARLEDPEFEVFILPRLKTNLGYLVSLIKCFFRKPETTRAAIVKSDRVVMDSEKEIWVELDGEVVGALPMTFEVRPDALSVIVP